MGIGTGIIGIMEAEKYTPTKEDLQQAEDNLTPEQRVQSKAHEEGFGLGKEKGKTVVYTGSIHSIEKSLSKERAIKQTVDVELFHLKSTDFKLKLNQLCLENEVNCSVNESKSTTRNGYDKLSITLEGTKGSLLKVIGNEALNRLT